MISSDGGITNKIEDHIAKNYQVGKQVEIRYQCVTDFTQ